MQEFLKKHILLLILFCTGASFIQRVTGFGFGIFIMTFLPHIMPSYGEATTLSGLLAMVQSLVIVYKWRHIIVWKKLHIILTAFIITSYFSVKCISTLDEKTLKHILGITLILVSLYFLFFKERISISPHATNQLGLGSLSGVMGGLFAMQGPPAVLYFLSVADKKEEYLVLTQMYFLIGNVVMSAFRMGEGYMTKAVLWAWCVALVGVFIGQIIGRMVFNKMSVTMLRKTSYAYMAVSGCIALLS